MFIEYDTRSQACAQVSIVDTYEVKDIGDVNQGSFSNCPADIYKLNIVYKSIQINDKL